MSVNTTRLRVRIDKYCKTHLCRGSGRYYTSAAPLAKAATGDPTVIARFRKGASISEPLLEKIDKYLTERGF